MKYTITKQGKEIVFESELNNEQAISSLRTLNMEKCSKFAYDLLEKLNLSEKQLAWVHYLVKDWTSVFIYLPLYSCH